MRFATRRGARRWPARSHFSASVPRRFAEWRDARAPAPALPVEEIDRRIAARLSARKARNFAEADRIRDELAALGVVLKDSKDGTTWESCAMSAVAHPQFALRPFLIEDTPLLAEIFRASIEELAADDYSEGAAGSLGLRGR